MKPNEASFPTNLSLLGIFSRDFGPFWRILGLSRVLRGPFGETFGPILGDFGPILEDFGLVKA